MYPAGRRHDDIHLLWRGRQARHVPAGIRAGEDVAGGGAHGLSALPPPSVLAHGPAGGPNGPHGWAVNVRFFWRGRREGRVSGRGR
eukprot:768373-Hanusia_phi.AAC.11